MEILPESRDHVVPTAAHITVQFINADSDSGHGWMSRRHKPPTTASGWPAGPQVTLFAKAPRDCARWVVDAFVLPLGALPRSDGVCRWGIHIGTALSG
jgi:hypothetical protein